MSWKWLFMTFKNHQECNCLWNFKTVKHFSIVLCSHLSCIVVQQLFHKYIYKRQYSSDIKSFTILFPKLCKYSYHLQNQYTISLEFQNNSTLMNNSPIIPPYEQFTYEQITYQQSFKMASTTKSWKYNNQPSSIWTIQKISHNKKFPTLE